MMARSRSWSSRRVSNAGLVGRNAAQVLGKSLSYLEAGSGRPIVFLSGAIGGAYMWRSVLRRLAPLGRCIALDLLGTGRSERLVPAYVGDYGLEEHRGYIDGFFELVPIEEPAILVLHGWASVVGFDFAMRKPEMVAAICHMESILRPLVWPDLSKPARDLLKAMRAPEASAHLLHDAGIIREHLRAQTLHPMRNEDHAQHVEAFGPNPVSRVGTVAGWNLIPVSGKPVNTWSAVDGYRQWLRRSSDVPKLLIEGSPGYLTTGSHLAAASAFPNQQRARVAGAHLLAEDSPDGVGLYLAHFVESLG